MSRRLIRALVAVAVPALTVATLSSPAEAAGKGAAVPTVEQAASVYPHLTGGTTYQSSSKPELMNKKCQYKPAKGAKGVGASYTAAFNPEDTSSVMPTGAKPMVTATAYKFRSVKDAIMFLHPPKAYYKNCAKGEYDPKTGGKQGGGCQAKGSMKKIKFKLGDERSGYQFASSGCGSAGVIQTFTVRDGKSVVMTLVMSSDSSAPSVPQSLEFVKLALKVNR